MVKVTVLICTYNRQRSLAKALGSIAKSQLPQFLTWEVLVVDNNSSDQTGEVVREFCLKCPERFRYFLEPRQGKSYALNRGILESRGQIIAFVDDDVSVEADWLHNLTSPILSGEYAGTGGRILMERGFVPPAWLPLNEWRTLAPLAMFDIGANASDLTEPPFGCNMAFRRSLFEKYGRFRTDLGPRPGSQIRSEDTEFGRRLLNAGERLRYEPSAVVYHEVPEHRMKKSYFLAWFAAKGRGDVLEFGVPQTAKWFGAGVPLFLFRRLAIWTVRWLLNPDPPIRFSNRLKVWYLVGQIAEFHRQARQSQHHRQSPPCIL
jgi:glycosyltransferase involved in cell wall biosynthesis